MGESEIKAKLVKRYVTNQATEEELEVFFFMLNEGKLDQELNKYMDLEMIDQLKNIDEPVYWLPKKKYQWNWKIAASVLVILGAGAVAYLNRSAFQWTTPEKQYTYIVTGRNEIKKIKLSDGSQIWLNASSKLKYPDHFDDKIRELFLVEGEAYFDVERDESRPFVVHAAGTETKVLGTEFNIRSYSYLPSVQVTVSKGKVSVATEEMQNPDSVMLLPNQRASFDRTNKITFQDKVNSGNAVAWKQGRMIFDDELLSDVAAELEQKYDVPIEIEKNKTQQIRLSAEFEASDSLHNVLDALSLANNLKYDIKDGKVLLKLNK